ncbi:MAG: hypothetical protein HY568_04695 [Candidatus Latescibacteria bacterium]|nr:hypothetical protein [Candidatus Latescibacterota bacterium]
MNRRWVGFTAAWVGIAALHAPLQAASEMRSADLARWTPLGSVVALPRGGALNAAAEGEVTLLRRQPAPVPPRRPAPLRRLRKGTISLGAQVSYGFVRGSSELNDHFDHGLGYAFRFRYMLSQSSALGFSFENHRYGSRVEPNPQPLLPSDSTLVMTTVSAEGVFFFHRERELTPYLLAGLGYASPNVEYDAKESRRVNEGPYAVVGAGVERFVRARISLDVSLRGYAQVGNSELSMFSQVSAGIHLYPGD